MSSRFITKFKALHGEVYDYSKFNTANPMEKGIIICRTHGEFLKTTVSHLRGYGCKICDDARNKQEKIEELKAKFKEIHGDTYDYSKFEVRVNNDKGIIICRTHGEFIQVAQSHLHGKGCTKCAILKNSLASRKPVNEMINSFIKVHGDRYDYSKFNAPTTSIKSTIICKVHGEFLQHAGNHAQGKGCPLCAREYSANLKTIPRAEILSRFKAMHGDKYCYDEFYPTGVLDKGTIICKDHGKFLQSAEVHGSLGCGCSKCSMTGFSKPEKQLLEELTQIRPDLTFIENHRIPTLRTSGRYTEIDIYIPELNLGIEYHGLYWHSEQAKENYRTYHAQKTADAEAQGIRLIQIFEDEYLQKKNIVMHRLLNILNIDKRIYARNTIAKKVEWKYTHTFLDTYHIQGRGASTPINYGLFNKQTNELEAVMTFVYKQSNSEYELVRYCSKDTVVGGFSKLLKKFLIEHNPNRIVSYSDRRWSVGGVYQAHGFTKEGTSDPGYFWIHPKAGQVRQNRMHFQKHKLEGILKVFDPEKSEVENCHANGYYRIFDAGHDKWILNLTKESEII